MPLESVTYKSVPVDCQRSTSGGKGNHGMFIERDPNICAAGLPTAQPDKCVAENLQHYLLKDEADCLIGDAIIPPPKPKPIPPLRKPQPPDMRNAGLVVSVSELINPPMKSKFQTLVEDMKDTAYIGYWKKAIGKVQDPVPMLPEGFDIYGTTFGKPTTFHGHLYDVIMPKEPLPDRTPRKKQQGVQSCRKYCEPPFSPDLFYGHRTYVNKQGKYMRCCLTDDRVILGNQARTVVNSIQANFQQINTPMLGSSLSPNDNIKEVPEGYSFGKLKPPDNIADCLSYCTLNSEQDFVRKCFCHLNSLRKCMKTRFLPSFYQSLFRSLKFLDKEKSGWLPKDVVYKFCGTKFVRFDPALIEPLLSMINAFDGSRIEYKAFVNLINYQENCPEFPKVSGLPDDCLDYRTTYREMVKSEQKADNRFRAGLPSGRYLDRNYPVTVEGYCRAHNVCLVQESDVRSCINPSILTLLNVSHRDMYQAREPHVVRRVFEASGETFSDERFKSVWEKAQKYHHEGLVCYETFSKALDDSTCKNSKTDEA